MLTLFQLSQIVPAIRVVLETFHPHLVDAMVKFEINTPKRIAAFIAQAAAESDRFNRIREAFEPDSALDYSPELGNIKKGDALRFRGRGIFIVEGRNKYQKIAAGLAIDCVNLPDLLEQPKFACLSAAYFWNENNMNELADKEDFWEITQIIVADITSHRVGLAERQEYYRKALEILT